MKGRRILYFLAWIACCAFGQAPDAPFTVSWLHGKCVDCKVATDLNRIQWVSRSEAWGIGSSFPPPGAQGAGDYVLLHTVNGGNTWKEVPDTWQHAVPPEFSFLDASHGWLSCFNLYCNGGGAGMEVRRTTDAGKHWYIITQRAAVLTMAFSDERNGIGQAFDVDDPVVRTTDGGKTWSKIEIPHLRKAESMVLLSGQTAWVTDQGGDDLLLFRTTDGGRSWEESRAPVPSDWPEVLEISFVDQRHGWMALGHKQDDEVRLIGTADGGRTWAPVPVRPVRSGNWVPRSAVLGFVSGKVGFVFSTEGEGPPARDPKSGKVLFTADGGAHWRRYGLPYSVSRCQAFDGDLLCSADRKNSNFGILTLHPK